jgi:hypothetical protein
VLGLGQFDTEQCILKFEGILTGHIGQEFGVRNLCVMFISVGNDLIRFKPGLMSVLPGALAVHKVLGGELGRTIWLKQREHVDEVLALLVEDGEELQECHKSTPAGDLALPKVFHSLLLDRLLFGHGSGTFVRPEIAENGDVTVGLMPRACRSAVALSRMEAGHHSGIVGDSPRFKGVAVIVDNFRLSHNFKTFKTT